MIPPYKDVHPTLPPFHEWVDKPFIFSVVLGEARPYDFQQMEACVGEASSPTRPWQKKINFPSRLTWFEKPLKPDSHSKGRNVPWRNPESGRKTGDSELVLLSGNSWTGSRYQVARLGLNQARVIQQWVVGSWQVLNLKAAETRGRSEVCAWKEKSTVQRCPKCPMQLNPNKSENIH